MRINLDVFYFVIFWTWPGFFVLLWRNINFLACYSVEKRNVTVAIKSELTGEMKIERAVVKSGMKSLHPYVCQFNPLERLRNEYYTSCAAPRIKIKRMYAWTLHKCNSPRGAKFGVDLQGLTKVILHLTTCPAIYINIFYKCIFYYHRMFTHSLINCHHHC